MPNQPDLEGLTIGDALRHTAKAHPSREALVFSAEDVRLTYAEYDHQVDRVALALLALGLNRGDHIAVWATNRLAWPLLFMAASRIGAVLVTVNPAYRTHELAYALKQAEVKALFLIDRFKSSDYFGMITEVAPGLSEGGDSALELPDLPELRWVVSMDDRTAPGIMGWSTFLARGADHPETELAEREGTLKAEDPINLQYTSGTTGFPKGVLLTHRSLLLNAWWVGDNQRLGGQDRVCVPVPFYHCFGVVIGILCCTVHRATLLAPSEYFVPSAVLHCVEKERATSLYGVPTMFVAELEDESFPDRDLSSLRTGIMAGSPCPIEVMQRVVDEMGAREVTIAYGLTEASPAITQTFPDDPLEVRVATVGKPIPGVEVRIVDPESGEILPDGAQGELQSRGHNTMLGYFRMPEATTAAILEGGWLRTGDIAERDSDGNYRITGRIKDMVIRGGENVYPREIEEFLFTHPAVESAQVVGVPDERFGEELCAWVKLRRGHSATEDEIREFCRGRLAYFKIPRYVLLVDDFPLTVTGKVQKFRMRDISIEKLSLT